MKKKDFLQVTTLIFLFTLNACVQKSVEDQTIAKIPIIGTWKLLEGTTYENGDTSIVEYGRSNEMIKILNATHFAFLNHDVNHGKDSLATFVAGGGTYTLHGNTYIENLDYCNYREYEGNTFEFEILLDGDTLIQKGQEKIESEGIDRIIVEKYVRIK